MLRVKKEYEGKRIINGRDEFILDESLSHMQMLYIKTMISDEFIEECVVLTDGDALADLNGEPRPDNHIVDFKPKSRGKRKVKKDDKDNEEPSK